jgi:hypothetical protein
MQTPDTWKAPAAFVIMMPTPAGPMYYLGTTRDGLAANFTPHAARAFNYTWEGAWRRIHKTPAFAGAVAVELSTLTFNV